MTFSVTEYADRVWNGEIDDSIVSTPKSGAGVIDVVDGVGWRPGFGNVFAFRAAGELLLFDTGNPYDASGLHQDLRRWSRTPVTTAVFSHGHVDHVGGTGPFDAEEGPALTVVAHERTGARFDRYLLTNGYNAVINQRQFQLPDLTWPTEYRRPDVTYRDGMTLTTGGLTCELFHVRGETDDATVAWFPRWRILCPGDMFIWLAPNCGNPQKVQRYPREWALALRRMAALDAEIMLPSHGAPVFGADRVRQALEETAEWLESLVEQTLAGLNAGARLDDLLHTVSPPAHLSDRPYLRAAYDEPEFVVHNLWRQYGGWYDGNPARLKPASDARLAAELAGLAGGAQVLADAARRHADAGEFRLAGHLAELAVLAEPDWASLHRVRAEVYEARAEEEASLMARGVFRWAASESRRKCEEDARGPAAREGTEPHGASAST
ncbi:alkyl sulfatase dimerization domain-containing protein [Streptomyces sp. WMMC940]|uniref:alkyl sulfatase dimerization domain-containing protein n=1 Tax=Streptomyces sp. WMMC940 TaxID=3015153 RepID=UPI0022B6B10D|nr:alkyl sulfatase dimerization domain-containing protein [Streptomyces sp. WMMC940]MCZ7461365.1 MBL fold metallo-hydrolase [Streptomyces sp. WMMC940]